MKKLCILFLVLACAFSTFLACNNTSETSESGQNESSQVLDSEQSNIPDSSITEEITFTISFLPENGTDERLDYEYKAGEQVTIPENSFIYEGYIFIGWENENVVYQAGETFTMPEHNVEMMAKWEAIPEEPSPSFSQSEYEYDKLGGFDLELPLDLDGANLYYVEIDGEIIAPADYSYNEDTKCLVISANIVLALSFETHEIVAITDAETEQPVKCLVTVTQSLKTTFDEETTKDFIYGKDLGVTFEVGYNTTTPTKLMQGEVEIDAKYYSYDEKSFTVSSEWLSYFSEPTTYSLHLSNNDVYEFTISTNVIFATDYDISTIHNTTASNIGHNPLYQYYDNVAIVEGPEGMNGKVLKITPNTVDVTYDCNGYLTLRRSDWDSTWREGGFVVGKYYVVSFDYMTEGTSVGEFFYGASGNPDARVYLLLGEENDGVVRNVKYLVSYDAITRGLFLRAKFIGGGGCVYVDNFRIAQLDEIPTLSANGEYELIGDYILNFDNSGFDYEVMLNGEFITAEYDANAKTLTLSESVLAGVTTGINTVTIKTAIGEISTQFNVVDNRICVLNQTTQDVVHKQGTVKLAGEFAKNLKVVSITRYGADATWDKTANSLKTEYISVESDGLVLSSNIVDLVYKTTRFEVQFDNGKSVEFSLNSNVRYYTDYNDANVFIDLPGNSVISQDRATWSRVDAGNGDYKLKYQPANAKQSHAVNAINGNGAANSILTFHNTNVSTGIAWYGINYARNDTVYVSFEYEVVTGEKQSYYSFSWWDVSGVRNSIPLSGSGVFTFIKPAKEVARFSINCPAPNPDAVADTYMYIDKYAVGWYNDPYLTQNNANVTRGGGAVTLAGSFASDLSVISLTRFGTLAWDNSKTNVVEIDKNLITISEKGLTVSAELIDKIYDTATFVATLSNEDIIRFTLTSNVLYYTDYDLFSVHQTDKGNIKTCQDTAMWKIVEVEGNKKLKYAPESATLSHAINGAKGNGCLTFSNNTLGNTWWYGFAFDKSKTLILYFDYEVVLGEQTTSYYQFNAIDTSDVHHNYNLTGSGSFVVELDLSKIKAFRINCPSGATNLITGTYMLIDNFGFGYKA